MAITMVYLTTLPLLWRLASPAHSNNKAVKSKAIMAVGCAAELSNWLNGSRAFIRALICLNIDDMYFCRNRAATTMVWVVAVILAR